MLVLQFSSGLGSIRNKPKIISMVRNIANRIDAVSKVGEKSRIGIIWFNGNEGVKQILSPKENANIARVQSVIGQLSDVYIGGWTIVGEALKVARSTLETSSRSIDGKINATKAILLFHNGGRRDAAANIRVPLFEDMTKGVHVTIFGKYFNQPIVLLLKRLPTNQVHMIWVPFPAAGYRNSLAF